MPIKLRGWDNTSGRVRRKYISGTPHRTYVYVSEVSYVVKLRNFMRLLYTTVFTRWFDQA